MAKITNVWWMTSLFLSITTYTYSKAVAILYEISDIKLNYTINVEADTPFMWSWGSPCTHAGMCRYRACTGPMLAGPVLATNGMFTGNQLTSLSSTMKVLSLRPCISRRRISFWNFPILCGRFPGGSQCFLIKSSSCSSECVRSSAQHRCERPGSKQRQDSPPEQ